MANLTTFWADALISGYHRLVDPNGAEDIAGQVADAGLLAGADQPFKERWDWGKMRMDPADSSDVTGSTYTYLVNGYGPFDNWTALFTPSERVRLRFVNASAMTHFDVRIPGLRMTVVQADGQNVRPVPVDEFQIGVAETYDVIVEPAQPEAFTLVAELSLIHI